MKIVSKPGLLASLLVAFGAVYAHGPTPIQTTESIKIDAPPAEVWAVAGEFGNIAAWHPWVSESPSSGGNKVGAERTLMLKGGGELQESLDEYDAKRRYLGYRLGEENVKAFPVSYYSATLEVKDSGGGSTVEWIGRYYRGDTGNFPPPELNDKAAEKAMTNFFRDGLSGLKQKVEAAQ